MPASIAAGWASYEPMGILQRDVSTAMAFDSQVPAASEKLAEKHAVKNESFNPFISLNPHH